MRTTRKTDRHRKDNVQLKAWVPASLRTEFASACARAGVTQAIVLTTLVEAYVRAKRPQAGQ